MHRWLLVLLVALLPLRGWVGEAMAGQMLQQRLAVIEAASAGAQTLAAASEDCHGHAAKPHGPMLQGHGPEHAAAPDTGPASDWQSEGSLCASCQMCSAVALLLPVDAPLSAPAVSQPRPLGLARLSLSAERAQLFKPPIS